MSWALVARLAPWSICFAEWSPAMPDMLLVDVDEIDGDLTLAVWSTLVLGCNTSSSMNFGVLCI